MLVTPDAQESKLRRQEGNPFRDPELDVPEGKRIECEGAFRNEQFLMRWSVVG